MVLQGIFVVVFCGDVLAVDSVSVTDDSRALVVWLDERHCAAHGIRDVGLKPPCVRALSEIVVLWYINVRVELFVRADYFPVVSIDRLKLTILLLGGIAVLWHINVRVELLVREDHFRCMGVDPLHLVSFIVGVQDEIPASQIGGHTVGVPLLVVRLGHDLGIILFPEDVRNLFERVVEHVEANHPTVWSPA